MIPIGRRELLIAVSAAALSAAAPGDARGINAPPAANIQGPIPVTAELGEPFRGGNEQPVAGPGLPPPVLIPYGYVEEEYFISGEVDGKAYTTSMLVRKPSDRARFSGLVAVETIHTAGAIPFWGSGRSAWMQGGHGWVAVGSQLAALTGHIKRSNPSRYESLNIPDVRSPEQREAQARQEAAMTQSQSGAPPAQAQPAPPAGAPPEDLQDKFSQAVMTQVGQLLKNNDAAGPFRGMRVTHLLMGGASQTGGTTLRYITQSHGAARRPEGGPIYDGYFPSLSFPAEPLPPTDAAILHSCNEGDLMIALSRQRPLGLRDDSDAPNDRYRHYHLTGASHVVSRGGLNPITLARGGAAGADEQLNQFPNAPFTTRLVDHLIAWVLNGEAPPVADRIELDNNEIVRDEFGNARGGIRSPYVDTPTVRYIAAAPLRPGDTLRRQLGGLQEPLSPATLRRLYPSKAEYLRRFGEGIDRCVAGSWLRREDGETLKTEEAANPALAALN